jgi:subtilisin family serine protease
MLVAAVLAVAAPASGGSAAIPAPAIPAPAIPAASPAMWVFFRDRGALDWPGRARDHALADVARRITPRALARRAKAARERSELGGPATTAAPPALLDDRDLPPDPGYIAAVAARGGAIRTRSGWLNAVSIAAPAESLARIQALPFVAEVRPVARESWDEAAGTAPVSSADALSDAEASSDAGGDFDAGPSFLQIDMLHIPEVHAMGDHGEGVVICVLDSGFELDHEAFRQLEVRGEHDFVNGDDDPSYDPRTDVPTQSIHGTAVLSTIAGFVPGKLIGPAYRAEYLLGMTGRIGSELPVEEDYWCAGLEWAEAEGADIVTSSLSYHAWYHWRDLDGRTAVATRAANLALTRGVLVVNAIGNEGPKQGSIGAPADAPGAISVGAVNGIGNLAGFSSVGPTYDRRVKPDVVAPGVAVFTALARTHDRYVRVNGTSFSTPLVAGCAALVLSAHPDWGPEAVRDALAMSASRAGQPDNQYGWGIVNARDAVLYPLLEGTVTDSITRERLPGATVRWEPAQSPRAAAGANAGGAESGESPASGSVLTDSTGAYVIPNLPRGTYAITVSKGGYLEAPAGPYEVPPNLGDANVALRPR